MKSHNLIQLILKALLISIVLSASISAGMVRGLIVNENNMPIPNAAVYLIDFNTGANINFMSSDSTGKFDVSTLTSDFREIQIKITGTTYPDQYWHPDGMVISAPDFPIKLDTNAVFTLKIMLESTPATALATPSQFHGSIEGQVKEGGMPIAGLDVQLIDVMSNTPIATVNTDSFGNFIFIEVPAHNQHYLKAIPGNGILDGYPMQYYAGMNSTLLPQVELSVPEFHTYFMGEFYVSENPPDSNSMNDTTIINDSSNAVIFVTLFDSIGNVILNRTDIYANYKHFHRPDSTNDSTILMDIASGHMFIELDVDGYPRQFYSPDGNTENSQYWFEVNPGDTLHYEIKMTMNPIIDGGKQSTVVIGSVKDESGFPIPNATVALHKLDNFHDGYHMSIPNFWAEHQLETDSSGNFIFDYLWGGNYVAFALVKNQNFIPIFYPSSNNPFNAETFNIVEGNNDTIFIEFKLKPGSTLTGFVKNKDGGSVTDTTIKVELHPNYNNSSSTMPQFSMSFESRINSSGKFFIQGIPAGNWHLNAWDENSLWAMHEWYNNEIVTDGINPFNSFPEIIMKAGGNIYGSYNIEVQDSNMHDYWNIGRLFPIVENFTGYPQFINFFDEDSNYTDTIIHNDSMDHEPTLEEDALWTWIELRTDSIKGRYKSSAIPGGNMRFIFSPDVNFDTWEFVKSGQYIRPSTRWSFFDNSTTLALSKLFTVNEGSSQKFDMTIRDSGFAIVGNVSSEGGEIFRQKRQIDSTSGTIDSSNDMGSNHFKVMVFIKEMGNYVKVAESFPADSNKFILNGLVDGEEYYFFMEAGGYPWQWYTGLPDSTTSNPDSAKSYTFSSANYKPIELYLQKQPHDFEDWNDEWDDRPSEIKNLKFTTIGLKSIQLTWSPSPVDEDVVKYRIFRIKEKTEQGLKDLFVWDSSHGGWEPADEESIMEKVDSVDVVDTFFIDNKISQDSAYMYVIFAINSKGEDGMALHENPILDSYITSIDLSVFKSSISLPSESWHMISTPGVDPVTVSTDLTDTSSKLFVYYWDEEADSVGVYSKYQRTNTLESTKGYWIYSTDPVTGEINEEDVQKLYPKLDSIFISLKAGWNQISNPYPYPIYPSFTTDVMTLHYYNSSTGGYETPEVMEPWKGYWIYSDTTQSHKLSETPAHGMRRRISRASSLKKWDLKISLKGTKYNDLNNIIGTINSRFDIQSPEPPSAFGAPQLYISEDNKKLSKSYKRSSKSDQKWVIALTPSTEDMKIEINSMSAIPEELLLIWTDGETTINLKENNSINIPKHNDTRYGTIIATTDPNMLALYSGSFIMRQNYPNPFKGITSFQFTLPYVFDNNGHIQNSDFTKVSLEIFNMAGRKVSTIIDKDMKVGTHRTIWDSKSLSAGAYLARFKAGKFIKTVKLFKIQ